MTSTGRGDLAQGGSAAGGTGRSDPATFSGRVSKWDLKFKRRIKDDTNIFGGSNRETVSFIDMGKNVG